MGIADCFASPKVRVWKCTLCLEKCHRTGEVPVHRTSSGDHAVQQDGLVAQIESRSPQALDHRTGAPWIVARSAGEILALAALFLSAVALVVVLDDADAPGSLREQFALLLVRLAGQANLATAIVLILALV